MTTLVTLVSGFGWHVVDLERAARNLDLRLEPVPFMRVSTRVGAGRQGVEARGIKLTEADGVLVRMMPPGSL